MWDASNYLGHEWVFDVEQGGYYYWNENQNSYVRWNQGEYDQSPPANETVNMWRSTGKLEYMNQELGGNASEGIGPNDGGVEGLWEGGIYDDIDSAMGEGGLGEDYNNDGVVDVRDIVAKQQAGEYTPFEFSQDDYGFNPTDDEFRTYVEQTGSLEGILKGFGVGEEYAKFFDPPDLDKLDLYGDQYKLMIDQAQATYDQAIDKYDLGMGKAKTDLEFAKKSADIGERSLFDQAGSQLISSKTQGDTQVSRAGFATHGGITSAKGLADKGIISSFKGQQAGLQLGLDQAFSTYDFTTAGLGLDKSAAESNLAFSRRGASLDHRSSVLDFWSGVEDDFYDTLGMVEGGMYD